MRYLPLTQVDRNAMLAAIGASSIDDLYQDVPHAARRSELAKLPLHQSEAEVERVMSLLASCNLPAGNAAFFIGAGAYRHHVPATVDHLIQRSEFLTTYTPYQPEIAQGTMQSLFEFQTQVAMLTGMEVANASLYDGSTAAAEACLMAARVTRRKTIIVSGGLHPHYLETIRTHCVPAGLTITALDPAIDGEANVVSSIDSDTAAVLVQSPNVFGTISDLSPIALAAHAAGALCISVFTEATAFGLIEAPGAYGVDIVAGEGQAIGNALNFGGPYVGLFAAREKFVRQMPGRLAGETVDAEGNRGFVLTLSTREQHIRRDKATSNICTNSGLCALAWTIHMTLLGEAGLRRLALLNHERACDLAEALQAIPGVSVLTPRFYNEFAIRTPRSASETVSALMPKGVLGGVPFARLAPKAGMDDVLLVCATETNTHAEIDAFAAALKEIL